MKVGLVLPARCFRLEHLLPSSLGKDTGKGKGKDKGKGKGKG
jgi:hypothetical protein